MLRIQDVDLTPNPQALKFILNERLLHKEVRDFKTKESAENDPLAKGIFAIEGIESVFYMDKFITVEKNQNVEWGKIQKTFVDFIQSFDKSLIPEEKEIVKETTVEESELLKKIKFISGPACSSCLSR